MKFFRSIFLIALSLLCMASERRAIVGKSDYKNLITNFDIYAPPKDAKAMLSKQELYKRIATKGISLKTARESLKSTIEKQKSVKMSKLPVASLTSTQNYSETETEQPTVDPLTSLPTSENQEVTTRSRSTEAGVVVKGEPITGATYSLYSPSLRRDLDDNSNVTNTAAFGFDLTLKLLNGSPFFYHGKAERQASLDVRIAREDLRAAILQSITNAEQQYYDLILKYLRIQIQQRALEAAKSLFRDVTELIRAGESDKISGLKAELQVTQTENDLMAAEIDLESAKQALVESMNLQGEDPNAFFPNPNEVKTDPTIPTLDIEASIREAKDNRPDIRAAHMRVEKAEIAAKLAKSDTYPSLDASVGRTNTGYDGNLNGALRDSQRGERKDLSARLTLNYIFFNNSADLAAKTTAIDLMKAKYAVDELVPKISKEVSNSASKIQIGSRKLKASKQSRVLAETQLAAEYEKFLAGESSLKNIVEIQQQVIAARLTEIQSRVDVMTAITQLRTAKGELPEGLTYQGD